MFLDRAWFLDLIFVFYNVSLRLQIFSLITNQKIFKRILNTALQTTQIKHLMSQLFKNVIAGRVAS